ncbi:cell division protein FtsQ/DivIB [Pedobacter sp. SAFR-022]|uniref:cell division protein FtsQ/DivIB n=1 Tax=Pedobacter sp. SAFR-022 TaxID=3436861 RepID=UPI003F7CD5CA
MLKRIRWKLVFKTTAWVVSMVGIVMLMSFVETKKQTMKCSNVKILIPGADNFIEREEIDDILKKNQGILIGKSMEQINLDDIERNIKSNPYIASAKVFGDMNGVIHIEIEQREPVLRIINAGGQDFYVDREGLKMPVSSNFTANVLVANGNISEFFNGRLDTLRNPLANDLYETALFIRADTLWDAQIEQLYVAENKDIELIPRVGNQRIILGDADSLNVKMRNLREFYKQAMPTVGWDAYKTINIKYTNQVVCERNKVDSVYRAAPVVVKSPVDSIKSNRKVVDSIVKDEILKQIRNN